MFVRNKIGMLATVGALSLMAGQAHAGTISFFSTGAQSVGSIDSNYRITSRPDGNPTTNAFVTQSVNGFPLPDAWFADNSPAGPTSSWISPQQSYPNFASDASGYYTYTYILNTVTAGGAVSGRYWADNEGGGPSGAAGVFLNGNRIGDAALGFQANQAQTFGNGAVTQAGVNALTFVVYNGTETFGNPSGLRVEADAIPEPAFFQLGFLLAGGGLAAMRRKRSRN